MAETTLTGVAPPGALDPIILEILWSRLISIIEEAESTLVRTSFSPIVGEADDHSAALLDGHGHLVAQTPSANPGFIGTLGHTTRTMLITNDPWVCCGHLNDINLIRPIFHRGKLIAYTANTAHMTDIGGRNSAESVDLFEEGLRILPSKLYDAGRRNEEIYKFLRANTRMPIHIVGDLNAQLAATEVAERRLLEMVEEYGLDDIEALADEIQRRTERVMREAIARLPDGDYYGQVFSDGFDHDLIIKAKLTIAGDSLSIDFAGTSDQIDRAINCPLNLTYAETVWAVRAALAPDLPNTDGALRPITITAPEGSILNPRFPAPVYSRTTVVHNTQATVFQALSSLVPDYIDPGNVQANSGCIWGFRFRGLWGEKWRPEWAPQDNFVSSYLGNGGQGASGVKDGRHCLPFTDNCSNMPIEVVENRMPVMFLAKQLRPDSGGPGKYRGGGGQTLTLRVLNDRPIQFSSNGDKVRNAPAALRGGMPGLNGAVARNGEAIAPRVWHTVREGDVITVQPPGGGGYGDPLTRDPQAVLEDVANGIVSHAAARESYGVAISTELTIDWQETERLRRGVARPATPSSERPGA
jgi:N-methylhydantoinase B